jgi:hypothetical protein
MPALEAPLQLQATARRRGKKLRREGAIADISLLFNKETSGNDQIDNSQSDVIDNG